MRQGESPYRLQSCRSAIQTDFKCGFIRAKTIAYKDFVALGGEVAAGKARDEGKEYVDGGVMLFKFNT